ncbi:MAG: hypothetical protein V4490_00355 [Pseudomonadota bacterium]
MKYVVLNREHVAEIGLYADAYNKYTLKYPVDVLKGERAGLSGLSAEYILEKITGILNYFGVSASGRFVGTDTEKQFIFAIEDGDFDTLTKMSPEHDVHQVKESELSNYGVVLGGNLMPPTPLAQRKLLSKQKEPEYSWIMNEQTVEKIEQYKKKLSEERERVPKQCLPSAGVYLTQYLEGKDIGGMPLVDNIQSIVDIKQLHVSAEDGWRHTYRYGMNLKHMFSEDEIILLGMISCDVPVTVFDNGKYSAQFKLSDQVCHPEPFRGHVLYVPAPLLKASGIGEAPPDRASVVSFGHEGAEINQSAYTQMIEERLLPVLRRTNAESSEVNKAIVQLPVLGSGQFAGEFAGKRIINSFFTALSSVLERHAKSLPNISAVVLDTYDTLPDLDDSFTVENGSGDHKKQIHDITYSVCATVGNRPKLSKPSRYVEDLGLSDGSYTLFTIASSSPLACPNSQYWKGDRFTDESTVGASTDACRALTQVEGIYKDETVVHTAHGRGTITWNEFRYCPPEGYKTWGKLCEENDIRLRATYQNIILAMDDGTVQTLGQKLGVPPPVAEAELLVDGPAKETEELIKPRIEADVPQSSKPQRTMIRRIAQFILGSIAVFILVIPKLILTFFQEESAPFQNTFDWMRGMVGVSRRKSEKNTSEQDGVDEQIPAEMPRHESSASKIEQTGVAPSAAAEVKPAPIRPARS